MPACDIENPQPFGRTKKLKQRHQHRVMRIGETSIIEVGNRVVSRTGHDRIVSGKARLGRLGFDDVDLAEWALPDEDAGADLMQSPATFVLGIVVVTA